MIASKRGGAPIGRTGEIWILSTTDRQPWLRAYLGNGNLAAQLVAEGGLAGKYDRPLHLMAGLYDRAPDREVEHPVPLPAWSGLRLRIAEEHLAPESASAYRQELDLRHGLARTHHGWTLGNGTIEVSTVQAVLRQEPHLALIRLTAGASMACELEVAGTLDPAREHAALLDVEAGAAGDLIWTTAQTRERNIPVALAATFLDADPPVQFSAGEARACLHLQPGRPTTLTWLVGVRNGRSAADPLSAAQEDLRRGTLRGADQLLVDHVAAWEELWQADVQVDGDEEVQRFVRAGLFALLCSTRADVPASIAPMGLSSLGYNGHIFWDADTWMYPPLLLLHPDLARGMLTYRQERLSAAQRRAQAEGYAGAMFPWESATDGDETTPSFARTGLKEHHITACVALAQWQYYLASGDRAWLAQQAWPILEAGAQFWTSRVTRGPRGYEIHDVIAADEYAEDIDNNAFTNAVVRVALYAAAAAARELGKPVPPEWEEIARGLVLARDGDLVLEFDGYDGRIIKQADVELLTFPLEHPLSEASIRRNLETYSGVTDPDGPAMSRCISAIVAAQLGRREEARATFAACYEPHLWGPFYSLAETRSNGEVNFLTGVGGALQALLFGFAGLRMHEEALAVDPLLPANWQALRFPALHWRGQVFSLAILPGDRAKLSVQARGVVVTVGLQRWRPGADPLLVDMHADGPCTCTLDAEGWQVEARPDGMQWQLRPRDGVPERSFVRLRFALHLSGTPSELLIEQRVRNGDD